MRRLYGADFDIEDGELVDVRNAGARARVPEGVRVIGKGATRRGRPFACVKMPAGRADPGKSFQL